MSGNQPPSQNPYDWSSPNPRHVWERAEVDRLAQVIRKGKTGLLHAGRGMGKTITFRAMERRLRSADDMVVARIDLPDSMDLGQAIVEALEPGSDETLSAAITRRVVDDDRRIAILIDELDAWVAPERRSSTRVALNQLARLSRETLPGRVGVVAAGGIGNTVLASTPWGSIFASRLEASLFLLPLDAQQLKFLAEPLLRARVLRPGWMEELALASGGIPLLACRALQAAWEDDQVWPVSFLSTFVKEQDGYTASVRSSIRVDGLEGPWRLLELIYDSPGEVPLDRVCEAVGADTAPENAVRVLVSAGLVHPDCDTEADPWLLRPNPSVLRVVTPSRRRAAHPEDDPGRPGQWTRQVAGPAGVPIPLIHHLVVLPRR